VWQVFGRCRRSRVAAVKWERMSMRVMRGHPALEVPPAMPAPGRRLPLRLAGPQRDVQVR
jgi:hypothetical protein